MARLILGSTGLQLTIAPCGDLVTIVAKPLQINAALPAFAEAATRRQAKASRLGTTEAIPNSKAITFLRLLRATPS